MRTATQQRRPPLGFFPDQPAPRLYDRIIEFHGHEHPRQLAESDGVLLIGVEDDGTIHGLAEDYKTLHKPSADGFELHLRNRFLAKICG